MQNRLLPQIVCLAFAAFFATSGLALPQSVVSAEAEEIRRLQSDNEKLRAEVQRLRQLLIPPLGASSTPRATAAPSGSNLHSVASPTLKHEDAKRKLPTYWASEASQHVGKKASVLGKVASVGVSKQGHIYLNIGDRFPDELFTGFIRSADARTVGDVKKFEGKEVAISGYIEIYDKKPQIIITSPSQIKTIEETAPESVGSSE